MIGASESSLKRWIDSGKLVAHKTSGGHRRIALPEAIEFIRENKLLIERPDLLGVNIDPRFSDLSVDAPKNELLEKYLLDAGQEEAFSIVLSEYISGTTVQEICDDIIQPALQSIGCLWEHDRYGIVIEHRATEICIRIMNQLKNYMAQPQGEIQAVGGSPSGDFYILPTLCVAMTLESVGIPVANLGANVPFESLLQAVDRLHPKLVWISASHLEESVEWGSGVRAFCRELDTRSIPLVIGGTQSNRLRFEGLSTVTAGGSMAELLGIVRQMDLEILNPQNS